MANVIKYNTGSVPANAIKSGNFDIGVNFGGYGSTSATNYYNGKTPNVSGYTIYVANGVSSPILYAAANDDELIALSNQLGGSGNSTIGQALTFFNSSSTMTCVNVDTPSIVTSGLTLNLDAGFTPSYPRIGTTWTDISGSGNTGTLINGPAYSSEATGCIVFDGNDDYVLGTSPSLSGSPFTLAIWVKPIVTPVDKTFLSIGSNANNYNTIYLQFVSDTTVKYNTPSDFLSGTIPSVTGNWNYIVVTMTISKTLSIYCNGSFINSSVMGGLYSGNTNVTVGAYNVGTKVAHFNGCIANVQIYNRVLSATEVLQNYYAGLQRFIPTDSLVLYLDGNNTNTQVITPTIANDISGNNKNGTLVNGVTLSINGQRSFLFDGIDDKITTTLSTLTLQSTWTVWVNRTQSVSFYNMFMSSGNPYFAFRSDGVIQFTNTVGGNIVNVTSNSNLVNNVWYFLTFVLSYSGSDTTMSIYKDGVLQTQSTFVGASSTVPFSNFTLGDWTLASYPFKGNIGNVRIYNRPLTLTEISTIYTATKSRYGY